MKLLQRILDFFPRESDKPEAVSVQVEETQVENKETTVAEWIAYYEKRGEVRLENMDAKLPSVSVLILTYNNLPYTRLCLKSLYANTTYPKFEVIVVDNASSDESPEWLTKFAAAHTNMSLILNEKNLGFAAGNNQAVREARGEYIIFLNNDTVVTRGWVEGLLAHMQNDPTVGLVGPVTNATGNEALISTDYDSPLGMETFAEKLTREMAKRSFDIRMLAFYCVLARKDQYQKLGGLDERFMVGMFEDDDMAVRYHQAGLRVLCAEDVFIHHFHKVSFGMLNDEEYQKIFAENQKRYEEKWGRQWEPFQPRQALPTPVSALVSDVAAQQKPWGVLFYRCNICGKDCETPVIDLGRETPSCVCGSTVRSRAIIHLLSMELFGRSLILPDFPERPDLRGWGMSDGGYADLLSKKVGYVNTYYDREPRFDITASLDPQIEGTLDFLISTEVFEHVAPPVSRAFENAKRLLKPKGVLILTVPYTLESVTREHFPELHQYEIIEDQGNDPVLKNITQDGREQIFDKLVFHGGVGNTLEMRVFSEAGLMAELEQAGFINIKISSEPYWDFGIYWKETWSLPIIARKM